MVGEGRQERGNILDKENRAESFRDRHGSAHTRIGEPV